MKQLYAYEELPVRIRENIKSRLIELDDTNRLSWIHYSYTSIKGWIGFLKEHKIYDEEAKTELFMLSMSSEDEMV